MGKVFIVSACLAGFNCKYNGGNNLLEPVYELFRRGKAIPLCPEQLGGLPTPRSPSKIRGGDGMDVLKGEARVLALETGEDVTEMFIRGAFEMLKAAEVLNPVACIMKERSPSCGVNSVYRFDSDELREGMGVASALLSSKGYKIISSDNVEQILKYLAEIE